MGENPLIGKNVRAIFDNNKRVGTLISIDAEWIVMNTINGIEYINKKRISTIVETTEKIVKEDVKE